MQRKCFFNTNAMGHFPDGERCIHESIPAASNDTLENLNSFLVTLDDPAVDPDRVTNPKIRHIKTHLFLVNLINNFSTHNLRFFENSAAVTVTA
jgi:hypothetical protein